MNRGPLAASERADVHAQLAALERAGVPVAQAVAMLRGTPAQQARWAPVLAALGKGRNLAQATVGLFTPLETAVLRAAIEAGSPALAHERLGAAAAAQARRGKQLRARMLFPLSVFAIALFLLPLPALIAGNIGGGAYLMQSLGRLLALAGIIALLQYVARRYAHGSGGSGRAAMESLALRLPVLGRLMVRRQAQIFFENLALLLGSGVAMFAALPVAVDTLTVEAVRDDYARLLPMVESGLTLAQAVSALNHPGNPAVVGMIATGEGSGELPQLLARYAQAEDTLVAERTDTLATWLPRLVYVMLAVWMAQSLFSGFAPVIKPDY
jgi:general secretion pathway protein F